MQQTVMTDRGPVPHYWNLASCVDCEATFHKLNGMHVRCKPCGQAYRRRYCCERTRRIRAAAKANG